MNSINRPLTILLIIILLSPFCACRTDRAEPDNEVVIRLRSDPGGLNLFLATSGYAAEVCNNIFFPLMIFDPVTLELEPVLIEQPPRIDSLKEGPYRGGLSYTFEILEEARWDNGSPVLASDYVFTYKVLMNPAVPTPHYRSYLSFMKDIRIDPQNPRRFTVFTEQPYHLAEVALSFIEIYPEYVYDPEGLLRSVSIADLCEPSRAADLVEQQPRLKQFAEIFEDEKYAFDKNYISGCGPYGVEEIVPEQRIVLKRKDNWWGDPLSERRPLLSAGPDRLIYRPVPDEVTTLSLLKNQQIDALGSIAPRQFAELKRDESLKTAYNFYTPVALNFSYIGINARSVKLNDRRVRRALAHLTPVEKIIQTSLYGLAERIHGPVHPGKEYYHRGLPFIEFNIEKARDLLAEAGWDDSNQNGIVDKIIDGQLVEMVVRYRNAVSSSVGTNTGLLLKANARKAGIEIELINQDFRSMLKAFRQRDYELIFVMRRRDPTLDDFRQSWHTSSDTPSGSNRIGFGNARSDSLIDAIRSTIDPQIRNELYRKFQKEVYDQQACVFLFTAKERVAVHKRFDAVISAAAPGFFPRYFKAGHKKRANRSYSE